MATGIDTSTLPATNAPAPPPRASRRWLWSPGLGLLLLGAIALVPLSNDASALHTWTLIVMYCVLAQGWNFIGGFVGYAAFGNVAFFGIGAYTTALFLLTDKPFWLGVIVGTVVAGLFAFLLGLPVLRLRGHYFAIATLGIAQALGELVAVRNVGATGGEVSLSPPTLESLPLFFYAFLVLAVLCLLGTTLLTRSRFGYALVAIRENEQAAEALGIATYWYKVGAFVLSAVPTAIAGGLYAYWATAFDPATVFDSGISVEMVLLTVLGGAGTILGPLLGGVLFEYVSYQVQASGTSLHNTLLGVLIVLVTIFLPQGLLRLVAELTRPPAQRAAGVTGFINPRDRVVEGVRRVQRFIAANGV